tara:strand:+ start:1173 stop:1391 length:219 start_codon:yes stop_codon:yes gene_type:complete
MNQNKDLLENQNSSVDSVKSKNDTKIMYATIKLVVKKEATEENITEAEYSFEHKKIIKTEWVNTEEVSDETI